MSERTIFDIYIKDIDLKELIDQDLEYKPKNISGLVSGKPTKKHYDSIRIELENNGYIEIRQKKCLDWLNQPLNNYKDSITIESNINTDKIIESIKSNEYERCRKLKESWIKRITKSDKLIDRFLKYHLDNDKSFKEKLIIQMTKPIRDYFWQESEEAKEI